MNKISVGIISIIIIITISLATKGMINYTSRTEFCTNCHVMNDAYESWKHSSHKNIAECSDCHVPHDSLKRKLLLKAKDGLRDVYVFTLGEIPDKITITESSKKTIKSNCLRCHETVMSEVDIGDRQCWDCHRDLPHGF